MSLFRISFRAVIFILFLTSLGSGAQAQDKELTLEDAVLKRFSTFYPESVPALKWVEGSDSYSYQMKEGDETWLMMSKVSSKKPTKVVSLEKLNKTYGSQSEKLRSFGSIKWLSPKEFLFAVNNQYYVYDLSSKKATSVNAFENGIENLDMSTKTMNLAYTIDDDLYVNLKNSAKVLQVTDDRGRGQVNGKAVHRFEFGINKGTFWSPSGNFLAFYHKDESMVTDYPLVGIDKKPAELNNVKYPMAGMASHQVRVGVYNATNGTSLWLETGWQKDHYLTNVAWDPNGEFIYIALVNRDQNGMQFNKYNAADGKFVTTIFEEADEKYVEPLTPMIWLKNKPNEFLWISRRDGYHHLYHYNTDGKMIRQVSSGNWEVLSFLGFDASGANAIVLGTGENPTETHVYKVNLSSGKSSRITKKAGTHRAQLNSTGEYLIDNFSSLETPRDIRILDLDGKVLNTLVSAKDPLKDYKIGTTTLGTIKGKSGTTLHTRLIKPSNFDANKKYPVLVYLYGGPHAQLVTNSFLGGASLWMHWLAEQGYLVFTLDNRGSSHRGKEFEQATFRELGKVEMEDQLAGVEYLKSLPYVDGNRLAVHGWSFGGFMTTSLMLKHPGVYNVGVAGGPVIDWKYYEVMYTERYMDTPQQNPEGYANTSLLDKVTNLEGKLLLIHGTVDDVVVWQHSLDFVKACVDNGVQMDYFVYPGHPHNVRGKDRAHLMRKVLDYVMENNK